MKSLVHALKNMEAIKEQFYLWGIKVFDLDKIPVGICILDASGKVEKINQAFAHSYGFDQEELAGQSFLEFIPEHERKFASELHERYIKDPYELLGRTNFMDSHDEKMLTVYTNHLIEENNTQKRVIFALPVADIQEEDFILRKQSPVDLRKFVNKMHKELLESSTAEKSKATAKSIVLHDLSDQLKNIKALTEVLNEGSLTIVERKELTTLIKISANKTIEELNHLKKIQEIEGRKYTLSLEDFDLLEVVFSIKAKIIDILDKKDLKLLVQPEISRRLNRSYRPYPIVADRVLIEMLLYHLLLNAAEASPEHQTIILNITTKRALQISVHNWGLVPERILRRFFEKYVTADKETGTGIGTYVSKKIAEAHDGMISVDSNEEEGTDVVVVLPISYIRQDTFTLDNS